MAFLGRFSRLIFQPHVQQICLKVPKLGPNVDFSHRRTVTSVQSSAKKKSEMLVETDVKFHFRLDSRLDIQFDMQTRKLLSIHQLLKVKGPSI